MTTQFSILRSKLLLLREFKGSRSGNEETIWEAVMVALRRDDLVRVLVSVNLEGNGWI